MVVAFVALIDFRAALDEAGGQDANLQACRLMHCPQLHGSAPPVHTEAKSAGAPALTRKHAAASYQTTVYTQHQGHQHGS
jgi:hypothetical protein